MSNVREESAVAVLYFLHKLSCYNHLYGRTLPTMQRDSFVSILELSCILINGCSTQQKRHRRSTLSFFHTFECTHSYLILSFDYHRECAVASEVPDEDCIPTDWNKLIVIYVPNPHFYPIPYLPSDTVPPQMCHKYSIFTQCVLL